MPVDCDHVDQRGGLAKDGMMLSNIVSPSLPNTL